MQTSHGHTDQPKNLIQSLDSGLHHFTFEHQEDYLNNEQVLLQVLLLKTDDEAEISIFQSTDFHFVSGDDPAATFEQLTADHPRLDLHKPWPLNTVRIPKPWGAEIWYTGIEQRGVCDVNGIPLPWLLDVLPNELLGSAGESAPLLLKILDPLPEASLGDLYFELHEKKIEVYIVTSIDTEAWPNGIGQVRYGFNQTVRQAYKNDEQFKAAYLASVEAYQSIRRDIDEQLDGWRADAGFAADQEVPPEIMQSWLGRLPQTLSQREATARDAMNQFTNLRDIEVGDIITVQPLFPHSLQHGVRVVEFQTASYERHILSFGQKVLTQSHWDTKDALEQVILDLPVEQPARISQQAAHYRLEVIADFPTFTAERLLLHAGQEVELQHEDYQLIINVSGVSHVNGTALQPEESVFIAAGQRVLIESEDEAILLMAKPRQAPLSR